VQLVTSDCHQGLRDAIASVLPGAAWQRCRTHCNCKEITWWFSVWGLMLCYGGSA